MARVKSGDEVWDQRQRIDVHKFSPHLSKVYLNHFHEIPESVRLNHPRQAAMAYLVTFNNNLSRWGDITVAMKAGMRACQRMTERIRAKAKDKKNLRESIIRA